MSQQSEQPKANGCVIAIIILLLVYLLPAHLIWYFSGLIGITERMDLIQAILWIPNFNKFFHITQWVPFILDCIISGLAWLGILKLCGVKL